MRVTYEESNRMYKAGLNAKKKHKAPSLTKEQFGEYNNMVNVLNTIGRDQSEICGFNTDRYQVPTVLGDMMLPIEISFTGDKYGNNVLSQDYKKYSAVEAGYVTKQAWEDALVKAGYAKDANLVDMVTDGKPKVKEVNGFRVWLTPDDFNELGSLILGTFKASTAEDKFTTVDTYKDFGSMEEYHERMTSDKFKVRKATTDYFPIDAAFDIYVKSQYLYDKEDMLIEWFKSICDTIISGN